MIKNEVYKGEVLSIGSNGEGVIKNNGIPVFVPFAIKGETVTYKVLKVEKNLVYGKVLSIDTVSSDRVEPRCPVYMKCGGCRLQHINYSLQLDIKRENIRNCFEKIAGINAEVLPTEGSEKQFGYRNKLQLPVQHTADGELIGFYSENSHRVVDIVDCPINPAWTKDVIAAFREFMSSTGTKGYEETAKSTRLKEITVKEINDNLIIVAVITDEKGFDKEALETVLKNRLKQRFSLFVNINDKKSNVIYGEKFIKLSGENEISGEMLGIKYKTGVLSFMQVNPLVTEKLYGAVAAFIGDNCKTVIDAYSGAGLMSALVAKKAEKVVGIEIIKEAVEKANELDFENGLENKVINYCGKCEDLLPKIIDEEKEKCGRLGLILDPPRKGCDKAVINAVKTAEPDIIVYVSCMPSTLARDIGLLVGTLTEEDGKIVKAKNYDSAYNVDFIKGFDMFPQTKHVETLVVLSHKKH